MREKVRMVVKGYAGESVTYQKLLVEVPKRQFKMRPSEEKMPLPSIEKEMVFHPTDTGFFSALNIESV